MRPLGDGEKLVSFQDVEVTRIDSREYLEMMGMPLPEDAHLLTDEEREQLEKEEEERREAGEEILSEEIIEIPDELGEVIIRALKGESTPIMQKSWSLAPGHENIPRCGLIVINIYSEEERPAAERTRAQIEELRKKPEFRKDVLTYRYDILRRTILIANLSNPRDPELKKALARIKRVVSNVKQDRNLSFLY